MPTNCGTPARACWKTFNCAREPPCGGNTAAAAPTAWQYPVSEPAAPADPVDPVDPAVVVDDCEIADVPDGADECAVPHPPRATEQAARVRAATRTGRGTSIRRA